ncbi:MULTISPECIES: hypothetical protein [Bradyrhizobium]
MLWYATNVVEYWKTRPRFVRDEPRSQRVAEASEDHGWRRPAALSAINGACPPLDRRDHASKRDRKDYSTNQCMSGFLLIRLRRQSVWFHSGEGLELCLEWMGKSTRDHESG